MNDNEKTWEAVISINEAICMAQAGNYKATTLTSKISQRTQGRNQFTLKSKKNRRRP